MKKILTILLTSLILLSFIACEESVDDSNSDTNSGICEGSYDMNNIEDRNIATHQCRVITGTLNIISPTSAYTFWKLEKVRTIQIRNHNINFYTTMNFPKLIEIESSLIVWDNKYSLDLNFPELKKIGQSLSVQNNQKLRNLWPLEIEHSTNGGGYITHESPNKLTSVGDVWIYNNAILEDLFGLDSIQTVGKTVDIWNNLNLPNCWAVNIKNKLIANGIDASKIHLSDNNGNGSCP